MADNDFGALDATFDERFPQDPSALEQARQGLVNGAKQWWDGAKWVAGQGPKPEPYAGGPSYPLQASTLRAYADRNKLMKGTPNLEDRTGEEENRFNDSLYWQPLHHFEGQAPATTPSAPMMSSGLANDLGARSVDSGLAAAKAILKKRFP